MGNCSKSIMGKKPINISAMPANEPSSPAVGIKRRTLRPAKDSSSFITPIVAVAAMPRYQVSQARSGWVKARGAKLCKGGTEHQ